MDNITEISVLEMMVTEFLEQSFQKLLIQTSMLMWFVIVEYLFGRIVHNNFVLCTSGEWQ